MKAQNNQDYLTGLYNRRWLYEECPAPKGGGLFRILYIDLDNFKSVNDLYGHEEGDRVLRCVADALASNASGGYPIRMSGDEFVLLLPGGKSNEEVLGIYQKTVEEIASHREEFPGISVISLSAGAVRGEDANGELQEALRLADDTMYEAKRAGKGQCVFYGDIREKVEQERRIADEAPEALENDRFALRCIPLLNLQNGRLEQTLVTALWEREDGSVLEPSEYRPILEGNGYTRVLDLYLVEKMIAMISGFREMIKEGKEIRFSMEISFLNILDQHFEERLRELLKKYSVSPRMIDLSLSERGFSVRGAEQLVGRMEKATKEGISLSLKNYGATFGSIRYLNSLPISSVRFDRSWLQTGIKKAQERKLIKSVIRLTKDARKQIIAMGELGNADRRFLAACGCDAAGAYGGNALHQPEEYLDYIKDKLPKDDSVVFDFKDSFSDEEKQYSGVIMGSGITFTEGISAKRGAVRFPGGGIGENVIELPAALFSQNSYTIALWVKPEKATNWSSAVYIRYEGGFTSFVPYTNADDGISVFRISVDDEGFFDTSSRAIRVNEWSHLCFAYDAASGSVRYYINGRRAHFHTNMPLQIGCRQVLLGGDPFQQSYIGELSSLCIYSYALSDGEVNTLYRNYLEEDGFCGSKEDYWMDAK